MMRFRRFEIAMLLTLAVLFTYAAAVADGQQETADSLLRLHVIANSDSAHDQAVKLRVRDALLEVCAPLLENAHNADEVRERLRGELPLLADTAAAVLREQGEDKDVTVRLAAEYYPTRVYETFALPTGNYCGLKVTIGAGEGHNWWCVVFPPLCTEAASATLTASLPGERTIRFRTAEWIGTARHWLQEKG